METTCCRHYMDYSFQLAARSAQHEKQIGYWVSEKGKCMKWLYNLNFLNIIKHSVKSCAINRISQLGLLKFIVKFNLF